MTARVSVERVRTLRRVHETVLARLSTCDSVPRAALGIRPCRQSIRQQIDAQQVRTNDPKKPSDIKCGVEFSALRCPGVLAKNAEASRIRTREKNNLLRVPY